MLNDFLKSQKLYKREKELKRLSIESNLYPNENILNILKKIIEVKKYNEEQVYFLNNIDIYGSCVVQIANNNKIDTYYFYNNKLVTSKEYRESLYNI